MGGESGVSTRVSQALPGGPALGESGVKKMRFVAAAGQ